MNENIPTSLNNPGDLMYAGQPGATPVTKQTSAGEHTFASFPTPQAGFGALLNQLGHTIKTKPTETLADWANTYAPPSENDTGSYIANLSSQLGVSPVTPIGQLESQIGKWADAVAKNEGYDGSSTQASQPQSRAPQLTSGQTPSQGGILQGIEALGGAAVAGLGGLLGSASHALPAIGGAIGGIGGSLLGPEGTVAGEVAGSTLGSALGAKAEDLLGGDKQTAQEPSIPSANTIDTGVSQAINNVLSQTVRGTELQQEAQKRGIPNLGDLMQQEETIPSVNENGDYEKVPSALILNSKNAQDAEAVEQLAKAIPAQSNVSDVLNLVEDSLVDDMRNTGNVSKMRAAVAKELNGLVLDKSAQTGKQLSASQTFMSPEDWLAYRRHLSRQINKRSGAAYALPDDERSALQHIERGVAKHLSGLAHLHGKGKEWDILHKQMEGRFLLKKALKAMPKKAQRDFKKEFLRDVALSVAGAALGKLSGTGTVGEMAGLLGGHLLSRKAGKRYYKKLDKKSAKRSKQSKDNSDQYDN